MDAAILRGIVVAIIRESLIFFHRAGRSFASHKSASSGHNSTVNSSGKVGYDQDLTSL